MKEKTKDYPRGVYSIVRKCHISGVNRRKLLLIVFWTFAFILFMQQFHQYNFENATFHIVPKNNLSIYEKFNIFQCIDSHIGSDLILPASRPPVCDGLILETNICKDVNSTQVFLMIIIETSPGEFEKRTTIRETWGSIVNTDKSVRLMFLLGKGENKSTQQDVIKESGVHRDIVQGDFVDSYKNLTIKSFLLLKWTSVFCKEAKFVAKVDTDIYLNIPHLMRMLKKNKLTRTVIGRRVYISLPIRDKTSKWYTSPEVYPNFLYPSYIAGPAYVISLDLVFPILSVCIDQTFPWEDIFITGICASKVNANLYMDWTFAKEKRKPDKCSFKDAVTGHGHTSMELRQIWKQMHDETIQCPLDLLDYWRKYLY